MGRTMACLVMISLAGTAFALWQQSVWAGIALAAALWVIVVIPRGDAP